MKTSQKPTYKLIKCIGFGGYGRVYDAIRSDDGLPVIIKLVPKSGNVESKWRAKFKWIEIQVKFFFFFDKSREIKEIFIIKNKIFKMIRQVLII